MRQTNNQIEENPIAVDIKGLAAILSCGQYTAAKIGEEAGAKIIVGRRVLYSVDKIRKYVNIMAS